MGKNTCKRGGGTCSDSKMNGNKYVFKLYKMWYNVKIKIFTADSMCARGTQKL